jgi:hypothetical protein
MSTEVYTISHHLAYASKMAGCMHADEQQKRQVEGWSAETQPPQLARWRRKLRSGVRSGVSGIARRGLAGGVARRDCL